MEPIWNAPALAFDCDGKRWLAISELHIGMESGLARRGAFLRTRTATMSAALSALVAQSKARRLLILGDVKDRVHGTSPQERRDVPTFFSALHDLEQVLITRGNHDAGLQDLLPKERFPNVTIAPASGTLLGGPGGVGALHGHAWPKAELLSAATILVGHTHAAARLVDEQGQARTEWAWARGRLDGAATALKYGVRVSPDVIVFPPFNTLLGGAAVNRDGILGPMGKLVDEASIRLHLLDGRDLGRITKKRRPTR